VSKKFKDPHLEREKERYENPIPSRESILAYLEEVGRPVSFKHLGQALAVDDEERLNALGFRLKAMLRDGQLMQDRRNRYCLMKRLNLMRGKVVGHVDGYGFVVPLEGEEDDLFLSNKQMRQVMHGDVVLAFEISRDKRGRREGQIHEIVSHANENVVGRFFSENGVNYVEPNNKRINQAVLVAKEDALGAKSGQMVLLEMIAFPAKRHPGLGRVVTILGDHMAPGMEIDVAIHSHSLPHRWPQEVLDEVARIPLTVQDSDIKGRKDLRQLDFVTIDGEDARDFDDAIFCKETSKGGWHLYVAIADVSHYVLPGSALDKEAFKRSTSVYFPENVVPMLPEQLSNGLCSLNPDVDRLCLVCEMTLSSKGKITRSNFYRAVIHSKARLTYTEVSEVIKGKERPAHMPDLTDVYQLYQVLAKARKIRGAMSFDTTETKIVFDENRKIEKIVPLIRNEAHFLIEECMLAANVAAARFVKRAKVPALYRVHPAPSEEKIEKLRALLGGLGLVLNGGKKPHPKHFCETLSKLDGRADKHLIETVMLRSLTQAQYIEKNDGHFGLAYSEYAHFTSPIRRYPDLLTHRAILFGLENHTTEDFLYTSKEMADFGHHCSFCERRADDATREVVSWLKCEYMQNKLGEDYDGTISAVTSFGVFVTLDDIFVDGLVHMSNLKGDYYQFDPIQHRLLGERTKKSYRLGDKLRIRVAGVDLDGGKIDFELIT
jgi:ribonuclease R